MVGIDEAQFFDDEIVQVCNDLANRGIRVIVAGLDMDYKGNPLVPCPHLWPLRSMLPRCMPYVPEQEI